MDVLVDEASTVFEPPFQRTTYLVTVVPLPFAASQLTFARPFGPSPLPSLGRDAFTPVGASGFAHGTTSFDAFEEPVPVPTEFTPVMVKVCLLSRSRSRKDALVVPPSTVWLAPEEDFTTYCVIGSPFASASVIAGHVTSTAPPRAVLTRSADGVPLGALGLPAGCSAEDHSDHSEGSSARFEARTLNR